MPSATRTLSRTIGVWSGAGVEVEHVGLLDSLASACEVGIVACRVGVFMAGGLRRPLHRITGTLRGPAVASAVVVLTAGALLFGGR